MLTGIKKALQKIIILAALFFLFIGAFKFFQEFMTFRKIVQNLKAESRLAEVLVVDSSVDEYTRRYTTTIKFLEYGVKGQPLKPKYFTFNGNQIQFQTLVVRFDDKYVEEGHRMKGKSIALFMKAFVLNGKNTQEFVITPRDVVPDGYRISDAPNRFEKEIWSRFWRYALDPTERTRVGIKNAQLEAPGSVFVPGTIYTLIIEHRGGIRIDTRPIPEILKPDSANS
ncbi:MAG: hypothetical protein AUJ71_02560 [Candidatus Omnitrophica bacterium CG1_02_49_16]|nr:MAG: hypothetical protein AUJ71_02560 [Candidatus Omnitrophica bacterium CG1_02_49_16]